MVRIFFVLQSCQKKVLSITEVMYFLTFTNVKEFNQCFYFYQSCFALYVYLSKECEDFSHLWFSHLLGKNMISHHNFVLSHESGVSWDDWVKSAEHREESDRVIASCFMS